MIQYYMYIWLQMYCVLSPIIKIYIILEGIKITWNYNIELAFKHIKKIVYEDTLMNSTYWKTSAGLNTNASDKNLCDVISQNNKSV